ncbi:MAG TPA: cytochrome c [Blastocatellia bacterium]
MFVTRRVKLLFVLSAVSMASLLTIGRSSASAGAPSAAQSGAGLFAQKCAGCHGKGGQGMPMWKDKGQPDFTSQSFQSSRSDEQLNEAITNGKGKFMPGFKSKLSADQITSLVAQVRAFGHK